MRTREFCDLGQELFGQKWIGPVARLLRINLRAVQRWSNGQHPPPAEAIAALLQIRTIVEELQAFRARQESRPRVG